MCVNRHGEWVVSICAGAHNQRMHCLWASLDLRGLLDCLVDADGLVRPHL